MLNKPSLCFLYDKKVPAQIRKSPDPANKILSARGAFIRVSLIIKSVVIIHFLFSLFFVLFFIAEFLSC